MIKELVDKVIESMREDCESITRLYSPRECFYCRHNSTCRAIGKLNFIKKDIDKWL